MTNKANDRQSGFLESVIALAVKVLAAISALLLNAVVTRVMSIQEVAEYMTINAFVLFWIMASANGIPLLMMRGMSEKKAQNHMSGMRWSVLKGFMVLVSIGFISSVGMLGIAGEHVIGTRREAFFVTFIVGWICLGLILRGIGECYRGLGFVRMANLLTAVNSHGVIATILIVVGMGIEWLLRGQVSIESIVELYVITLAAVILCSGIDMFRKIGELEKMADSAKAHPMEFNGAALKAGVVLAVTELCIYVMTQGDVWFVKMYGTANDVALYGIASKMAFITSLFLIAINSAFPPIFSRYIFRNADAKGLEAEIYKLVKFAALAAAAWIAAVIIVGGELLSMFFGIEYADAKTFLLILCFGHFISVVTGPCGMILLLKKKEIDMMKVTLMVTVVYVLTIPLTAGVGGAIGVACSSALAFGIINVLYALKVRRLLNIQSGLLGL